MREPADIFARDKLLAEARFALVPVGFEKVIRDQAHFAEHASAVRCDHGGIGNAREASLETRRHVAELLSLTGRRNRLHSALTFERDAEVRDKSSW